MGRGYMSESLGLPPMYGTVHRPYPKRGAAWAALQRAPEQPDGSISSSHWLSGATSSVLTISDLQVMLLSSTCHLNISKILMFNPLTEALSSVKFCMAWSG